MLCPKCKKEIEDNSLKCKYCNTKVASICKNCGAYNPITATECSQCHNKLLKICGKCGAANHAQAVSCRKCGYDLKNDETPEISHIPLPEYTAEISSQQKVKVKLTEAIKNAPSRIITLSGGSGCGKSLILENVIKEIKSSNLIWLKGTCTQFSQLTPFGYFQDVLLNFFNLNNFCVESLQQKKSFIKFINEQYPNLGHSVSVDILNILYPDGTDRFENLYKNKERMLCSAKKFIQALTDKNKLIFVIDNFENIDGMSFDFLEEILKDDLLLEKCKFIFMHNTPRPGLGTITSPKLSEENYADFTIAEFSLSQTEMLLNQHDVHNIGNKVFRISEGNPAIIEQIILLHKDIERTKVKNIKYDNFESVINSRLAILRKEDFQSYKILTAMSVLGYKFFPAMLENFCAGGLNQLEHITDLLSRLGYINGTGSLSFEFNGNLLWKAVVSSVKHDECFEDILKNLYESLCQYKLSSLALTGYIMQKLNFNTEAFAIWTQLMKQASYCGDIGLYIITQKQALKLIENLEDDLSRKIKKNIYTRLGKILEPINREASFEYLQKAILMLDDNEDLLHIELLGYLSSCASKLGNYWGAIECAENVLNKIPEKMELERTLVKSRLVNPMLRLGNYGQVINLIETEILPVIEKYLAKGKNTKIITSKELFSNWLYLYLDFAEAVTFQGDGKMFDIISNIFDIIEKNNETDPVILCRANLALALANTIKGDLKTSSQILDDILKDFSLDNMDEFIVSRWNFIDVLNKFFERDYDHLYAELFNVVTFANNVNDNFTKNILKTILAKILKDKNETKKALTILEEQVSYFANEKVSTGVLLCWYLIAQIKLITNGTQFALDIANKAVDIAQSANINNYYFISLFNKLICEIYMAKQDFDSAKVYLEKSIFMARQFGLEYIMVQDFILFAKYYQELALINAPKRTEYVKQALKMFQQAKNVNIVPSNTFLQKTIKEELAILTSFCKLNGVLLKKSTN